MYPLHARQRFNSEVIVIGDGLVAFSAALEATVHGRQTMVAAAGPALASELTIALQGRVGEPADAHLSALADRVAAAGGAHGGWLDPALAQMVADQMLTEAGVTVLLYAIPIRAIEREGRAAGVLMAGKDGLYTIAAGAIVDATEGGVLFRNAGAEFVVPETVTATRTLTFQFAGEDLSGLPGEVEGFALAAYPTWPGEVCVTLTGSAPYDGEVVPAALHRASRLAEQAVAKACREAVPGLAGALVSHSGHVMVPLSGAHLASAEAPLPNLLGAGAWVSNAGWGDLAALSADGARAGALAAAAGGAAPDDLSLAEDISLQAEASDVTVFGGGTGGAIAGWAAARNGAQTLLFEAGWALGGIPTCGGIHAYYWGVEGGLQDELHAAADLIADDMGGRDRMHGFHPEARKLALDRLLGEAGVAVRYGWTAVAATRAGDRVANVLLAAPGRLHLVAPAVVVDGTGDADVAAHAGAPMAYGRASDGVSHQYSQSAARFAGDKLTMHNFDAGYVDPRDVADLTRGRRHALQLYWRDTFAAEDRPFNISYLLGLRQSRHIVGDYTLTLADQVANRHFPDVIAFTRGHQDNHAYDYENENDEALLWVWGLGFWQRSMPHELPYRCLTPQGVANVLVACRAVSVSREAHMLFRMIRDMYRIGEAAGTAAALAAADGGDVRGFEVAELQGKLRETGAMLDDWPAEEALPAPEALVAELVDELPRVAVWHLYQHGTAAAPALRAGLASDNENTRWWCAVAGAMTGLPEAAEELLAVFAARDERLPRSRLDEPDYYLIRMAPRWVVAMALLGRLQERGAVAPTAAVLAEDAPADVLIAAVRALGRIGDPAGVAPLRAFIARDDLPTTGRIQNSMRHDEARGHDITWALHLATADALRQLGAPAPELAAPYADDPRAYVRAYAARLLG
ncbi:FAD-dependent oxidoreductase [bacterium]|nr:FAD-dependent oxidoreductase [bacterium]